MTSRTSPGVSFLFLFPMNTAKKILVVDDEATLCETLAFNLENEGYDVDTALSAEEALTLPLSSYDLVILDIMMGEISGTKLASLMKANPATSHIPVIFCTAKDTEEEMVAGLDLGADDYIAKPYSIRNVLARVRSVLRRSAPSASPASTETPDNVSFQGLSLSLLRRTCTVDGNDVRLTKKEFEILLRLLSHPGRIFSRAELLKEVWPDEVIVLDRVVDVNITRIRHKIGPYGRNIVTRSGYGYGFIE